MADPLEIVQRGRGWLQEGEAPEAVVEEATELLGAASDDGARAAWLLVIAEAQLKACCIAEALDAASQSVAVFKASGAKACEAAALRALVEASLLKQEWDDAIAAASAAANIYAKLGDKKGEAAMHHKFATGYLMQMGDPYTAGRAALSAAQMFHELGEKKALAEALQTAAQAQMLYDPEQALKAAKDALAACSGPECCLIKADVQQTVATVKAQIALSQKADMAGSMSGRGDQYIPHKWPKVAQQQGQMAGDAFAVRAYNASLAIQDDVATTETFQKKEEPKKSTFMRKSFKWTDGRHATDEAWFRQEVRFIPPPGEED